MNENSRSGKNDKNIMIAESYLRRLCATQEAAMRDYNCLKFYKEEYHDLDVNCTKYNYRKFCKEVAFYRKAIFESLSQLDERCRDVLWELYIAKSDILQTAALLEIYTSEVERLRLEGLTKLHIPEPIYKQIELEYEEWVRGDSIVERIKRRREEWRDE